jgi:hypothetical protein
MSRERRSRELRVCHEGAAYTIIGGIWVLRATSGLLLFNNPAEWGKIKPEDGCGAAHATAFG